MMTADGPMETANTLQLALLDKHRMPRPTSDQLHGLVVVSSVCLLAIAPMVSAFCESAQLNAFWAAWRASQAEFKPETVLELPDKVVFLRFVQHILHCGPQQASGHLSENDPLPSSSRREIWYKFSDENCEI